jgi:hypothetical protein
MEDGCAMAIHDVAARERAMTAGTRAATHNTGWRGKQQRRPG